MLLALYGLKTPFDVDAGGVHFKADITFTRWAIFIALLFVTLPFVVRTVQPVLLELDREMEEAAASLGAELVHDISPDRASEHPPGDPLRR